MKKFLLVLSMVLMVCSSALAAGKLLTKDPNTYEGKNGINIKNLWIKDRFHYGENEYANFEWCNVKARTAVMQDGIVYVARSEAKQIIPAPGDTVMGAVVYRFDALTGDELPSLDVTLNGAPYGVFLGVNTIGKDNFGHVWVAPYTSESAATVPIYQLNTETGELTLIASLDKGDVLARTDYVDIVGDITLEQAECNVMTPAANAPTVYAWHNDQGGDIDTWDGFFSGDPYIDFVDFYPVAQLQWGLAPCSRFVLGEDEDTRYSGECFYIDGFNTVPVLYANDCTIIDGFGSLTPEEMEADSLLMPKVGCNGIAEFALADRNFIAYPIEQYSAPESCRINVCELGEGMAFSGMQRYWTLPADGLGQTSDTGLRIQPLTADYTTEGGKDAVLLFDYKCFNGMAVYIIGEGVTPDDGPSPVDGDVNGDGVCNSADVTALYQFILNNDSSKIVNGDQNEDGTINSADVTAVYKIILGS